VLRGEFWAQPRPAPTVVVCHGYRTPRTQMRPVAALEYAHGFNVLLFDFRGHGESDPAPTSGGLAEVRDLQAALEVAARQPETLPGRIVLHGFSMGAAVALLTPPHPDVVAIIADSPYAHLDAILRRLIEHQLASGAAAWPGPLRPAARLVPALAWTSVAASRVVFRVRFRRALIGHPARVFDRARLAVRRRGVVVNGPRPAILLIHAAGDHFIPIEHARQIAATALKHAVPLETYFVEAEGHCGAYGHDPDGYVSTVMRFLRPRLPGLAAA
jgi:alpha-beta hydrolase superfamily lysophospholipase